ncbi:MAG: ribonuclease P protein component [Opitutaceae bacterium]|jgi:ribonuclease P protein component
MRFCAEQRLRRQLDFQHVRTLGRRHDCGAFMLWHARQADLSAATPTVAGSDPMPAPDAPEKQSFAPLPARLGVVASRVAVGNAVLRARAKRRLREVFRHHQELVPAGHDLLLVARGSLNRLEYREIERKFVDACRKIFPPAHV